MKERPILFKAEMVQAILDGRKTQTRRVVQNRHLDYIQFDTDGVLQFENDYGDVYDSVVKSPYGVVGDQLWVKEAWLTSKEYNHLMPSELPEDAPIWYLADGVGDDKPKGFGRYRHAWFMPRIFSRTDLVITAVRVERLQDISGQDVTREGLRCGGYIPYLAELWNSINGKKHPWSSNPFVWVYEFKRIDK